MVCNYVDLATKTIPDRPLRCFGTSSGHRLRIRRPTVTIRTSAIPWLTGLLAFTSITMAQDPIAIDGRELTAIHSTRRVPTRPVADDGPRLPIWRYQVISPVNGASYSGYMVGTDPFLRGARMTTIPVILVPFIVQFTNTATGFTTTFDPSAAPDMGCTAGQTAMSLVENSPIFQNYPWTLNGVDVGVTQYIDAFQRSNFGNYLLD